MLCGEAINTYFIVFGFTRPGLDPTNYHTRGEHANHYITYEDWTLREIIAMPQIEIRSFQTFTPREFSAESLSLNRKYNNF